MPPGYIPADLLTDPHQFGRHPNPAWKTVPNYRQAQLAAAQLQHHIAHTLHQRWPTHTADHLAAALSEPERVDYFRRKLHGQVPLTLVELHQWTDKLGLGGVRLDGDRSPGKAE